MHQYRSCLLMSRFASTPDGIERKSARNRRHHPSTQLQDIQRVPQGVLVVTQRPEHLLWITTDHRRVLRRLQPSVSVVLQSSRLRHRGSDGETLKCRLTNDCSQVAYGDYGQECFKKMEEHNRLMNYSDKDYGIKFELQKVVNKIKAKKLPFGKHTWLLLKRNWSTSRSH